LFLKCPQKISKSNIYSSKHRVFIFVAWFYLGFVLVFDWFLSTFLARYLCCWLGELVVDAGMLGWGLIGGAGVLMRTARPISTAGGIYDLVNGRGRSFG
jgi:hypothetical protein